MGSAEDTEEERANWHWRNSMRPARFFAFDARAAIPFFVLIFYFRPVTLALATLSTIIFSILEKKGLTFPSALRSLRTWLNGEKRPAWLTMRRRRFVDYG